MLFVTPVMTATKWRLALAPDCARLMAQARIDVVGDRTHAWRRLSMRDGM